MTKFEIFDAPVQPDNRVFLHQLQAFSESVTWLSGRGIQVDRHDFSSNAVKEYPAIENLIENSGVSALPVIILDGKIVLVGRYPTRNELSSWAKLQHPLFTFDGASTSCNGPSCG